MAFNQKFDVPDPDKLIVTIRNYCRSSGRGYLGTGEVLLRDRSDGIHTFDFKTFYNGYDALTIGVHRCELPVIVAA